MLVKTTEQKPSKMTDDTTLSGAIKETMHHLSSRHPSSSYHQLIREEERYY
jgi:hypothetical protein